MKVREIILEAKAPEAPKPRNFVAKHAKTGGAGAHKDKKKAAKQGDVKHKGKVMAEGAEPNISTLDAVFNEHDFYRLEHIWPALEAGDKEEALRQINHYLRKGKNRAWWGDLQAVDIKIDPSDVENSQVMWSKPIQQGTESVNETGTATSTVAANVNVGAIYKNTQGKTPKKKDGTAKNALDMKANLLTGGSIKR